MSEHKGGKEELKPCPCGKTPKAIEIYGNDSKWKFASGYCCSEWHVEFRTQYHKEGSVELAKLSIEAWNDAPRATPPPNKELIEQRVREFEDEFKLESYGFHFLHQDISQFLRESMQLVSTPKVDEESIYQLLCKWGERNNAIPEKLGFRRKLAKAIAEHLRVVG